MVCRPIKVTERARRVFNLLYVFDYIAFEVVRRIYVVFVLCQRCFEGEAGSAFVKSNLQCGPSSYLQVEQRLKDCTLQVNKWIVDHIHAEMWVSGQVCKEATLFGCVTMNNQCYYALEQRWEHRKMSIIDRRSVPSDFQ